jgi:PAS domain S-box-containing protein
MGKPDNRTWSGLAGGNMPAAPGELERRTAMLDAIGYAATQIIGGPDWRAGIRELLDRLGQATGVSRVTLFEIHTGPDGTGPDGPPVETCRYDWAEPGLALLSGDRRYENMPIIDERGDLNEWTRQRQRGEVVQALIRELSGYDRQVFEEHGTLSFLSVPIMLRSGCWGFIGFDDCHVEREWSRIEIDVLRTAASLIAGAMERAWADERLRLSEERYALVARGANDGLWDWDVTRDHAYFSPRLHEILGLPEDALGHSMARLMEQLVPEDRRSIRSGFATRIARRAKNFEFEGRLLRDGSEPRWIITRGRIVYDGERPVRVVGGLRDISDRKRAEASLRDSEARMRAILDTAFDAVVTTEEDGRIRGFNAAASRIFGYAHEEVTGRRIGEMIAPAAAPGDAGRPASERAMALPQLLGRLTEMEAVRKDGRRVPIELSMTEVQLPQGRLLTLILRDISERKRFQQQLTETERQRASLARYFSPNMVDEMLQAGERLDAVRSQNVTVLFADLFNFTALSATMPGEQVLALLREFHGLVEDAVFSNEGTLDKYIGDGLMATFGTPRPGPRDATHAVACARRLVTALNRWNERREAAGEPRLRIGIGLHVGEVILGDVGSAKRLELTVVGDTVNAASRIEALSRTLDAAILASEAVLEAVRREGGEALLAGFCDMGTHALRGRKEPITLWGLTAVALGTG